MNSPRKAPSARLLVGLIFTFIGMFFLPIGIFLRTVDFVFFVTFGAVGAILLGIGIALLIVWNRQRSVQKEVREKGNYVIARVTEISRDMSVTINGVHPYYIRCSFTDHDTGITHTFRSGNLGEDPSPYLESGEVRVYINPDNLDEYSVEIPEVSGRTVVHH